MKSRRINLNRELIQHPVAAYYIRVEGDSMAGQIEHGDCCIVDRAAETGNGHIVVARVGGEFTIKILRIEENGDIWLDPANPAYQPIKINEGIDFEIWGRVASSFRKH